MRKRKRDNALESHPEEQEEVVRAGDLDKTKENDAETIPYHSDEEERVVNDVRNEDKDCARMVSGGDRDVERERGRTEEIERKRNLTEKRAELE